MAFVITGGAGFVGSNLVQHLHQQYSNPQVLVIDALLYPGAGEALLPLQSSNPNFKLIKGSVSDPDVMLANVHEGDILIHLAVETGRPAKFIETQVGGTKTVLDIALQRKVKRFIYQSTSDIYGINDSDDLTETAPVRATQIYAATKLGAEALVTAYHHTYGLPVTIVRPVSIYGPRQYPAWLISRFITRAQAGLPLPVMGTGHAKRDWIYVEDVCRALVAVAEAPVDGEVFNIGTGKEYSVLEIAKEILRLTGRPESLLTFLPERPGDFQRQVTSAAKARQVLGWKAEVDFLDGLSRTVDWYRANQGWVATQLSRGEDDLGFRITEPLDQA
jgi:dTDP-glucose 4,6-dehydratase